MARSLIQGGSNVNIITYNCIIIVLFSILAVHVATRPPSWSHLTLACLQSLSFLLGTKWLLFS